MTSLLERLDRALSPDYRVDRALEPGGMGLVFVAHDTALDRRVAIKVLRPELATEHAVRRFLREARILAALQHPGILAVHRAGEADGLPYYVMDYIEGDTLATRLARGSLPADEAVHIARSLLDALGAVHGAGIVHRDVKPANIFLVGPRVLLGDFGIALGAAGSTSEPTTLPHAAGTPGFMAPEQAVGGEMGPRADLYAVGMILYEMLAGRRWPRLDAPERANWEGVPAQLRSVLERALAWSPEQRWIDAAAFRAALDRAWPRTQAGAATTHTARITRPPLLHPLWVGLAVLVIAAAAVYLMTRTAPVASTPRLAVLPLVPLRDDTATRTFGEGQASALINAFRRVEGLQTRSLFDVLRFDVLRVSTPNDTASLRAVAEELEATHVITGTADVTTDERRVTVFLAATAGNPLWRRDFTLDGELSSMYEMQDSIVAWTLREFGLRTADAVPVRRLTNTNAAYLPYTRGLVIRERRDPARLGEALQDFMLAIAYDSGFVHAHAAITDVWSLLGSFEYGQLPPHDAFRAALRSATRALELAPDLAEALAARANIAMVYEWDWSGARRLFERAIERNRAYVPARNWYALLLGCRADFDAARVQLEVALQYTRDDPLVLVNLARNYYLQQEYAQAESYFRRAVELDPDFVIARVTRGINFAMHEQYDSAIAQYRHVRRLTNDDPPIALALLAHAHGRAGDVQAAQAMLDSLRDVAERRDYTPAEYFALAYLGMGRYADALAELERAVENRSSGMILLRVEPVLEPLRSDARFEALTRRVFGGQ